MPAAMNSSPLCTKTAPPESPWQMPFSFSKPLVNKKLFLVQIEFESEQTVDCPCEFRWGDKIVGQLVSFMEVPSHSKQARGLMYVKKEFWNDSHVWTSSSGVKARQICT